jgi:hypothetical protein
MALSLLLLLALMRWPLLLVLLLLLLFLLARLAAFKNSSGSMHDVAATASLKVAEAAR